ncbi:hypothetical protein BRDID11002_61950 [Bradyrhizobium diazoefficiens]
MVWDPKATKSISAKRQMSRIDYNVFEGFACTGGPAATLSRGRVVWTDGDSARRGRRWPLHRTPRLLARACGEFDLERADPPRAQSHAEPVTP